MAAGVAGGGRMRASHADREQVVDTLKTAFVHGRLTRDELDARTGRALTALTWADLAALTADIPAGPAGAPPPGPPAPARRGPLARAAVKSGICLIIAVAAGCDFLVPGDAGPAQFWGPLLILLAVAGLWSAVGIMAYAVLTSWDQRSSRRRLPPRPGPGGQALDAEQRGGTGQVGHDPALPRDRPGQARADLRSDSSPPARPHSSGRGARAPRGIRPVPDAV